MKLKINKSKAMLELEAIDAVRLELAKAVRSDLCTQGEVSEIHARLMSLYAALDVHNVTSIIEVIDYKEVA
jgi:hypothetical protein